MHGELVVSPSSGRKVLEFVCIQVATSSTCINHTHMTNPAARQWSVEFAGRDGRPRGGRHHHPRQVDSLHHQQLLTFVVREFMEEALDSTETGSKKVSFRALVDQCVGFQVSQLRAMVEAFFADGHELYRGYVQVGFI